MVDTRTPPVIDPAADVGEQLRYVIGDMGTLETVENGYKLKVCHTRAFPWDDVFKLLIYRGYRVSITGHKADLFIEADR
jgi:hypothetical protein